MKHFGVFRDGKLVRTGVCQDNMLDAQAGDGETVREGRFAIERPARVDGYRIKRAREYPAIGDQLDALWDFVRACKAAGIAIPGKASDVLTAIDAVKAMHKKGDPT